MDRGFAVFYEAGSCETKEKKAGGEMLEYAIALPSMLTIGGGGYRVVNYNPLFNLALNISNPTVRRNLKERNE